MEIFSCSPEKRRGYTYWQSVEVYHVHGILLNASATSGAEILFSGNMLKLSWINLEV